MEKIRSIRTIYQHFQSLTQELKWIWLFNSQRHMRNTKYPCLCDSKRCGQDLLLKNEPMNGTHLSSLCSFFYARDCEWRRPQKINWCVSSLWSLFSLLEVSVNCFCVTSWENRQRKNINETTLQTLSSYDWALSATASSSMLNDFK